LHQYPAVPGLDGLAHTLAQTPFPEAPFRTEPDDSRAVDEAELIFPADRRHEVALAVGGYLRKKVSEAAKERLREMGAKHRFKKGEVT
jgi:hypothetical protein